jgi:glycolate oxidase FAD binding subunit
VTAALRPRDEADLAEIIATTRGPLEPLAGGSKRAIGRPIEARVLDLTDLNGIVCYEPDELVLSARAATPLAEVERLLAGCGQRLAFEPPPLDALLGTRAAATLGGTLAANASGSRRFAAGAARDHFLGFRAVNGRGERFKAGGRVVKNVTGYDLPKLLAGSWGTLAVLTEVTVRVHAAPECEHTLVLPADDAERAAQIFTRVLALPCEVSGAAFEPGRGVCLRLEGFETSVLARSERLLDVLGRPDHDLVSGSDSGALWRQIAGAAAVASAPLVWRLSLPPADVSRVVRALAPERYLIDWGGGLLWVGAAEVDADTVRGALKSGHATLIKAPASVRAATAVFPPLPAALALLAARLKAAFDPADRLNPGRMR